MLPEPAEEAVDEIPNARQITKCLKSYQMPRKLPNASEVSKCLTNHQMPQNYFTLPNAVGFPPNAPSRHRIPLKRPSMIGSCLTRIACEAAFGWSHHYRFFEPIIATIKHVDVSMIYHDRVVFDSYCLQCNGGHEQCSYHMMVTSWTYNMMLPKLKFNSEKEWVFQCVFKYIKQFRI